MLMLGAMNRYGKKKGFIKKPRNDSEGDEERELERKKERELECVCLCCGVSMGFGGVSWIWRGEGQGSHMRIYCIACIRKFGEKSGLEYDVCGTGLRKNGNPHPYFGG